MEYFVLNPCMVKHDAPVSTRGVNLLGIMHALSMSI